MATGQAWKLYVTVAGFTGSLGLLTAAFFSLTSGGRLFMAFAACGLFLGAATFVWFTAALRCPHCSAKFGLDHGGQPAPQFLGHRPGGA